MRSGTYVHMAAVSAHGRVCRGFQSMSRASVTRAPCTSRTTLGVDVYGDRPDFERTYRLTAAEYFERRGSRKAKRSSEQAVQRSEAYRNGMHAFSQNSLRVASLGDLERRTREQSSAWLSVHEVAGSRAVARRRFDAVMRTGRTNAEVARKVLGSCKANKPVSAVAWGGARWAHNARGSAPCPAGALYRMLLRESLRRKVLLVRERETNTSKRCCACLGTEDMLHPSHLTGSGDAMPIYGLYQCISTGCHRTHDRDVNGASNIWRAYYERSRGRPRPPALMSRLEYQRWLTSAAGGNVNQP